MSAPSRFPLAWPPGRQRTRYRKAGGFYRTEDNGRYREKKALSVAGAMDRLEAEIERLGAQYPVLSSNLELTLSGRPRSDRGEPADPGVCLYFTLKGEPIALACDTYTKVAQNIAALAAHIEATRAITRHGVATAAEMLRAFAALPPPAAINLEPPWWEVLGLPTKGATVDEVNAAYRREARHAAAHEDLLKRLNVGRDRALKELNQ